MFMEMKPLPIYFLFPIQFNKELLLALRLLQEELYQILKITWMRRFQPEQHKLSEMLFMERILRHYNQLLHFMIRFTGAFVIIGCHKQPAFQDRGIMKEILLIMEQ